MLERREQSLDSLLASAKYLLHVVPVRNLIYYIPRSHDFCSHVWLTLRHPEKKAARSHTIVALAATHAYCADRGRYSRGTDDTSCTMVLELLHHVVSLYHSFSHLSHAFGDAHDEMTSTVFARAIETCEHLRPKLPPELARPRVGIVCGSGLGGLAQTVNQTGEVVELDYKDVPNFPVSTGEFCDMSRRPLKNRNGANGRDGKMEAETFDATVPGHEGKLIFATLGEHRVPVVLLVGRAQSVVTIDSPFKTQPPFFSPAKITGSLFVCPLQFL